jgi:hypothetical protein
VAYARVLALGATHKAPLITLRHYGQCKLTTATANLAAALVRAAFGGLLLNALPDRLIYQRCYIAH